MFCWVVDVGLFVVFDWSLNNVDVFVGLLEDLEFWWRFRLLIGVVVDFCFFGFFWSILVVF